MQQDDAEQDGRDGPLHDRAASDPARTPQHRPSRRQGRRDPHHVRRRRFGPWTVGVVVVSLLAGSLFALSARTASGTSLRSDRADQAALVRRAEARNAEVQDRIDELNRQVDALSERYASTDSQVAALRSRVAAVAPGAGLAPVRGPVLEVTLDDAPRGQPVPDGIPPDYLVVHQQDVQAVVNALWRGGAEAMMLMDQRVISTSAVRCVGNTLILQGRVYSPPYRIRAIGDFRAMRSALASSPEVSVYQEFVNLVNLTYRVEELGQQTFPAFEGSTSLKYARPVVPQDADGGVEAVTPSGSPSSPSGSPAGSASSSR